jgi:hypothetical protein
VSHGGDTLGVHCGLCFTAARRKIDFTVVSFPPSYERALRSPIVVERDGVGFVRGIAGEFHHGRRAARPVLAWEFADREKVECNPAKLRTRSRADENVFETRRRDGGRANDSSARTQLTIADSDEMDKRPRTTAAPHGEHAITEIFCGFISKPIDEDGAEN